LSKLDQIYEASLTFFETIDASVEIQPSLVDGAGMGMFARQNIQQGTIISFYPVHAIGVDFGDSSVCIASNDVSQDYFSDRDSNAAQNTNNNSNDCNYQQYLIGSRPLAGYCVAELFDGDNLFVDVDPNQVDNLVGKAIMSTMLRSSRPQERKESCSTIKDRGEGRIACTFPLAHVPFWQLSQRVKSKREELFTTYGGSYWLEVLVSDAEIDVTDAIRQESLTVAKDIFTSMQAI
jgi:hypothetical protein